MERKEYPPLPPHYVSFAQLQERWLQKQEDEKLKKKQEEEKRNQEEEKLKRKEEKKKREAETQNENQYRRGLRNDGREMISSGSVRNAPPGNDGRATGAILVKGKGKEAAFGGFENGDGNKSKRTKNTKKRCEKKKSVVDGVNNGNEIQKEKPRSEIIKECGSGSKGIDEITNDAVLPKDAVRNEIPDVKRLDIGGGFRRNGSNNNRISGYTSRTEHRFRVNENKETDVISVLDEKMEGEKGHGKKRRERRGNGGYRESIPNKSEGNEVEQVLVKNANVEICGEICGGLNGIQSGRNHIKEEHRGEEEELSDNRVVSIEKKVDSEVLVVESGKNGEKVIVGNVYNRRNWNWKGNINREIGGRVRSMVDGRRYGRYGDGLKKKPTGSGNMMWVKKEDKLGADASAEVGSSGKVDTDDELDGIRPVNGYFPFLSTQNAVLKGYLFSEKEMEEFRYINRALNSTAPIASFFVGLSSWYVMKYTIDKCYFLLVILHQQMISVVSMDSAYTSKMRKYMYGTKCKFSLLPLFS